MNPIAITTFRVVGRFLVAVVHVVGGGTVNELSTVLRPVPLASP